MTQRCFNSRGFVGILTVLLGLVVIGVLYFVMFNPYRTQPVTETAVAQTAPEHHIDTATYQSALESTTSEVKRLEKLQLDQTQDMDLYKLPGQ